MHTPPTTCPSCQHVIDGAGRVTGDSRPEAGDFTVCVYCASVAVFTETLMLRTLTDEERAIAETEPDLNEMVRLIRLWLAAHN